MMGVIVTELSHRVHGEQLLDKRGAACVEMLEAVAGHDRRQVRLTAKKGEARTP
jgi:hypothetical protein